MSLLRHLVVSTGQAMSLRGTDSQLALGCFRFCGGRGGLENLLELLIGQLAHVGQHRFGIMELVRHRLATDRTAFSKHLAHAIRTETQSAKGLQPSRRGLVHLRLRAHAHRRTTNQVGHVAQLLVRVVLLRQEVLIREVERALRLLLLQCAELGLLPNGGIGLLHALLERSLRTHLLNFVQLTGQITLTSSTLQGNTRTAKGPSLRRASVQRPGLDTSLFPCSTFLNVNDVLHVRRHVTLHSLPEGFGARHRPHCRLLQGAEVCDARLGVRLVRVLTNVRKRLALGQNVLRIAFGPFRKVYNLGLIACLRAATTAAAHILRATHRQQAHFFT